MKGNKPLKMTLVLLLIGLFGFGAITASNNEVNEQTLMQEENEALRAENEHLNEIMLEQDQDIQQLKQANRDMYGQLIIYRDQVKQMSANQEREYYMEEKNNDN